MHFLTKICSAVLRVGLIKIQHNQLTQKGVGAYEIFYDLLRSSEDMVTFSYE